MGKGMGQVRHKTNLSSLVTYLYYHYLQLPVMSRYDLIDRVKFVCLVIPGVSLGPNLQLNNNKFYQTIKVLTLNPQ